MAVELAAIVESKQAARLWQHGKAQQQIRSQCCRTALLTSPAGSREGVAQKGIALGATILMTWLRVAT